MGPTSSGKSRLAVETATFLSSLKNKKKCNIKGAEIISADSRQIYKFMNIGTGKITKRDMRGIPHHMLDIAHPRKKYTAEQFRKIALKKIKEIQKKEKIPIICGGTGFYISALIEDFSIPLVPPNHTLRKKLEREKTEDLLEKLRKKDPERAKTIDSKNRRRLIRALEIVNILGKVPKRNPNQKKENFLILGIKKEKDDLKNLISKRLDQRLRKGLIAETRKLRDKHGLSWKRLEEFGFEYRYTSHHLQGKIDREELRRVLNKKNWHYARRQITWFKKDRRIHWVKTKEESIKKINDFFKK